MQQRQQQNSSMTKDNDDDDGEMAKIAYLVLWIKLRKLDDSWPIITSLQSGQTPFSSSSSERFTIDERDSIEQKIES
ncbi:hypothetical protein DERF_013762 [Dermatophagoides farinae]|uniref:Uncharacterized protein n=1 Tax=Dermatophagoides farinae TaxID=6954 RepID=A0A922KWY6_DERFA|nr:hypothetical protein DERF_013762 [Dermatophagoides farinae]